MKKKGEKEMVQETKFRIQFVFVRELNECGGSERASKLGSEGGFNCLLSRQVKHDTLKQNHSFGSHSDFYPRLV